jgi:hypothetical protein
MIHAAAVLATLRTYAAISREAFECGKLRAPAIVGKAIDARLRFDLGPVDFFLYDLMNRPRATWGDYLREHPHNDRMLRILHPFEIEFVARDKVLAAERCLKHGVAIAPILAVVGRSPDKPCAGAFPMFDAVDPLVEAMRGWPDALFVKPVSGSFGAGASAFDRDDEGWREGTQRLSSADLARRLLEASDGAGTLVQPRIANHPDMAGTSCGTGLCATRIITALTCDGPEIIAAIHKVLGRAVIADNFSGGATGNLLAHADPESGQLGDAYGRRRGHRFLLTRYSHHPVTRQRITGFRLPQWPETRALAIKAATAFPELPLLGHDIAITADGPLFLETNSHWRVALPQVAHGGMRPILREVIPRLAAPAEVRAAALAALN